MSPLHRHTPLVVSPGLGRAAGAQVFCKLEALQPTGSFKLRGIGHLCQTLRDHGATELVSSSGGNAGLATAYAGRQLGLPVTVVIPTTSPTVARQRLAELGAAVEVHGDSWDEADARARALVGSRGAAYVPPFDHPLLWAGHASMMRECAGEMSEPDAVVLAVGGGGLLCGVLDGLDQIGWRRSRVVAVETEGAASLARSLQAGHPVELPRITSVARSLGARRVSDRAFERARQRPVRSLVLGDAAALTACFRFLDDHRLLVEPACGAALAAVYQCSEPLAGARSILLIVCGGAVVTLQQLHDWRDELAGG
jgi:L-serine/L-threonine ammonia-lyase